MTRKKLLWLATLLLITALGTRAAQDFSVALTWTASAGATGYTVYRSQTSGSNYQLLTTSPVTGTSYQDGTVVDGQTYYYVVTAINSGGASGNSNQAGASIPTLQNTSAQVQVVVPSLKNVAVTANSSNVVVNSIETYSNGTTQNITALTTLTISGATPPPVNPPAVGNSATFAGTDTTTHGAWLNTYGQDGYALAASTSANPSYGTAAESLAQGYTWAGSSIDIRALQYKDGNGRIASTWFSIAPFNINVSITDGNAHKVSLYLLDWDSSARIETISVQDATTGKVLDTKQAANFNGGIYYSWNVSGKIKFVITMVGGANAVVSGVFFN